MAKAAQCAIKSCLITCFSLYTQKEKDDFSA